MYNFSGIFYRIWGVSGVMLLLGIVVVLFEKPWKGGFAFRKCKIGLVLIAVSLCLALIYFSRIVRPDVAVHTGVFEEEHRNSQVAPPLPFTTEYIFDNGDEPRKVLYLDVFSKKQIIPDGFAKNHIYTVCYDRFTKVILRVDVVEV